MVPLISQLSLTSTLVLQLGKLVRMSLEQLFLLVWVAALIPGSRRELSTSPVTLCDVLLAELADLGTVSRGRLFDTVKL